MGSVTSGPHPHSRSRDGETFVILSPPKPAKGEPCNGCGYCCQAEACRLSTYWLKSDVTPCIALEWNGAQYRCGLLRDPSRYIFGEHIEQIHSILIDGVGGADGFRYLLGVGRGCDAEMGRIIE